MSDLSEKIWFNYNSGSQKVRLLGLLLLVATMLGYAWYVLLTEKSSNGYQYVISWRHYLGILLFLPALYFYLKNKKKLVVYLGCYLSLATLGIAGITYFYTGYQAFRLGSLYIKIPFIQPLPFLALVTYFFLNATALFNIELDYREKKKRGH